jgi:hypothetical protein
LATPNQQNEALLLSMELQEVVGELYDLRVQEKMALTRRDELLVELAAHGVSHRALAVLADLTRPRVSGIIGTPSRRSNVVPITQPRSGPIDISAVNAEFPCCGHRTRFRSSEHDAVNVRKQCHHCGTRYELTRAKGPVREDGRRVDFVTWRVLDNQQE